MVATMATMTIYQGLAYVSSNSETYFNFPDAFKKIGQGKIGPIPICVILMIIAVIIGWFLLNKTYLGRYIYSIGGNEEATRLAGVNTLKVRGFLSEPQRCTASLTGWWSRDWLLNMW